MMLKVGSNLTYWYNLDLKKKQQQKPKKHKRFHSA